MPTGELIYSLVKRVNTGLHGVIVPTMFWTEMGFQYLGPVDGHDGKQLEETLRQAMQPGGSVPLIHVVTHKGRGYEPAEDDPVKFHQPSSPLGAGSGAPTYSKVFAQTVSRLMREDETGRWHQRRHAGGHRTGGGTAGLPGQGLRRRHRGAARGEHGRGHGFERAQPVRFHLLDVPTAGLSTR